MLNNLDFEKLFLLIFLIISIIIIAISINNDQLNETFVLKFDDTDTDQLESKIDNKLLGPNRYIYVNDFNEMVKHIRWIIYRDLYMYSKMCTDMNGSDGPQPNQNTFSCHNDANSMQDEIIKHVAEYIIDTVRTNYGINMHPYQVVGDFIFHLNLLEHVIYPLMYSGLYTIHGIQYFNPKMLENAVYYNLNVKDVLLETLLRRGIHLFPDTDTDGPYDIDDHL